MKLKLEEMEDQETKDKKKIRRKLNMMDICMKMSKFEFVMYKDDLLPKERNWKENLLLFLKIESLEYNQERHNNEMKMSIMMGNFMFCDWNFNFTNPRYQDCIMIDS
jgi:hypothetical protein